MGERGHCEHPDRKRLSAMTNAPVAEMRFPRTTRLDGSDSHVFEPVAAPGEWAVSGAFAFADADPETLTGKARQAFANGFLGMESFGWSTFVAIADIDEDSYEAVVSALARHFVASYGAPTLEAALVAARQETEFAASLSDHEIHTLLAVERSFGDDGIVERFKVIQPPGETMHAKIWTIIDDEDT